MAAFFGSLKGICTAIRQDVISGSCSCVSLCSGNLFGFCMSGRYRRPCARATLQAADGVDYKHLYWWSNHLSACVAGWRVLFYFRFILSVFVWRKMSEIIQTFARVIVPVRFCFKRRQVLYSWSSYDVLPQFFENCQAFTRVLIVCMW